LILTGTIVNNVISRLSHLGVIEISGDDASSFLQGQFTSDITQLREQQSQFSAWCNPQGRVIANFLIIRDAERYLLLLPAELLHKICQRLKMFVLRSKVTITDKTGEYSCAGLHGEQAIAALDAYLQRHTPVNVVCTALTNRHILIGMPTAIEPLLTGLSVTGIALLDYPTWQRLDVEYGIPWILTETSEQVLPQELNLDNTGGLSYNKGCYPGQEIIARLHFRGQVKRRLFAAQLTSATMPTPGSKLSVGPESASSGIIINSARDSDEMVRILAVVNTEHAGTKTLLTEQGDTLQLTALLTESDT
jgi:folate-binding protein YgfZ